MHASKSYLRYKKEKKNDWVMEKERARVSKDSFLFLLASTAQSYCCHKNRPSKEVTNKRILITNPQGRPRHFEKGLRCLQHIIQVFEETNSAYFESFKYQGVEVKNRVLTQKTATFCITVPHYFAMCFSSFMKGILKLLLFAEKCHRFHRIF